MKELKKYLVRKKGTIEEEVVYALNQENAVKKFYVPSLKKLKSAFPYKSSGYVEEVDTGDYTPYTFKYEMGKAEVNFDMIKIGPLERKLESDVVYIKDAWIPKTIMSEVKYASDESIYGRVSAFHKESIFLMMVCGGLIRRCAYNPFTQCLIVSRYVIDNDTFCNTIDVGENPIKDFVFFDLDVKSDFSSGFIHFKLFDVKNMKDKDESYKIIKTLEMLKNNGIKDETMLIFAVVKRKVNKFSHKYFMKAKVIW